VVVSVGVSVGGSGVEQPLMSNSSNAELVKDRVM